MSDRPFFNTRYTYPGFLFLFWFGFICRTEVLTAIPDSDTAKLILGIIFTLSGAPIGFVISQFGYSFLFNGPLYKDTYGQLRPYRPFDSILFLEKKFGINIKNIQNSIAAMNYLYLLQRKTKQTIGRVETEIEYDLIRNYVQRRVDILNTLGSSMIAIFLGTLFGLCTYILSNKPTTIDFICINWPLIVFSTVIIGLMRRGFIRITQEQRKMVCV
jgi:hypothetical protein